MATNLENVDNSWNNISIEDFSPYVRPTREGSHPEINPSRLHLQFLLGDGRNSLNLLTTGDASLLLLYRNRRGYISSFQEDGDDLEILQFQGSKQEGYRVTQGLHIAKLMADQVQAIASDPQTDFRRITMPNPTVLTENMSSVQSPFAIMRIPRVIERYHGLIAQLGMSYSEEESKFIAEVNR